MDIEHIELRLRINICQDRQNCQSKHSHIRVGDEIHHCGGGIDGCECGACINLFWGAMCGDQEVRQYLDGTKDAREYDGSDNPSALDML